VSASAVNVGTSQAGTVNIGVAGSTIALKGTANVSTLDSTSATTGMGIGNNITNGTLSLATGGLFTGGIGIGSGSLVRTGTINIGTGGSGGIALGNSSCNTNLYNVYLDGATVRMPRLLFKNTKLITIVVGNSNNLLETFTSPTGNNFDLIFIVMNGDINLQNTMVVSTAVNSTQLFVSVLNGLAGSARFSYAVYAP